MQEASRGGVVRITADHRERRSAVPEALRKDPRVAVRWTTLRVGDYDVGGHLLVERKTVRDLAQSLVDGRLFGQAARLASSGRPVAWILEGVASDLSGCGVSRESLQGAMVTLTVLFGLPVLRARDARETARLLVYAADQLRRTARGAFGRPGYRPRGRRARQLYILQGLPGVGPDRAERLLDRFGTIGAVVTAEERDLRGVPGIGRVTAGRIAGIVREAGAAYGMASTSPRQAATRRSAPAR